MVIVGLIIEVIDLVRFVFNCFFGKMGYVIVEVLWNWGVIVMLVVGFIILEDLKDIEVIYV